MVLVRLMTGVKARGMSAIVLAAPATFSGGSASVTTAAVTTQSFGLWPLFLVFAKAGAVLFGSGYVLLAFLRADLVEVNHQ